MIILNRDEFLEHPILYKFIENSVNEIINKNTCFCCLTKKITQKKEYLDEWKSIIKETKLHSEFNNKHHFNELLSQLIPVFFTSLTAFFGFLLAISNFENFANILGNYKVILIFMLLTILMVLVSIYAIYKKARHDFDKEKFSAWFFLSLVHYLFFIEIKKVYKNTNTNLITAELQNFFKNLWFQNNRNQSEPIKTTLTSALLGTIQSHNKYKNNRFLISFCHFLNSLIHKETEAIFSHVDLTKIEDKREKNVELLILRSWKALKQLVVNNSVIWEVTVANLAMSAGFVGVTIGSIKGFTLLFNKYDVADIIASPQTGSICLILMGIVMMLNLVSRISAEKSHSKRDKLFFQRALLINECFQIMNYLKKNT